MSVKIIQYILKYSWQRTKYRSQQVMTYDCNYHHLVDLWTWYSLLEAVKSFKKQQLNRQRKSINQNNSTQKKPYYSLINSTFKSIKIN